MGIWPLEAKKNVQLARVNMEIKLTKNATCMIDDEDFEKISPYKWYAHNPDGTALYAATRGKEGSDLGLNKFAYLLTLVETPIILENKVENLVLDLRASIL